jgi:hypothetical protein
MTCQRRFILPVLLAVAAAQGHLPVHTQNALTVGGYSFVSEVRRGKTTVYTYRATLSNAGTAISGATATAVSTSGTMDIVDGTLTFGPVATGGTVASTDTFSFRRDPALPIDFANVQWTIAPNANTPPLVDAGPDLSTTFPTGVTLSGSASDDGLPKPRKLTVAWTQTSGPGSTMFGNPARAVTTADFSAPGVYVLRLTASDGSLFAFDEVTVTVLGINRPPVANAGPDQTIPLGALAALTGSGSSDPDGDPLTYSWTLVSRPSGSDAALDDPASVMPSFVVDVPGTYVIELIVHDGAASSAPDSVTVSTTNSAPVANAGPDQTVAVTETVTLDGAGSADVDGDPLTFAWSFVSQPPSSTAELANPSAVSPSFVVDAPGTYVVALVVSDGTLQSAQDTVTVTTFNSAPVARAGTDQSVLVGGLVTLDGSGSTDVDGDALTYAWGLTSIPSGSGATLDDPARVTPSFVADRAGTYVAQLIVNDGLLSSAADTIVVTTANTAPIADAGPDQVVTAGGLVSLDGSGSSDVDGDSLQFSWALTVRPDGSDAILTGENTPGPSFVADLPGSYVVQLIVDDGTATSAPDTVTITTTNAVPVADAGPDQIGVPLGVEVTLFGGASTDADGHALTFFWSLLSRPAGSSAVLDDDDALTVAFTPDLAGEYVAQLIVNDGFVDSAPDTILIRTNVAPTADAGPDQTVEIGATVLIDGSASTDAEAGPLTFAWSFVSVPAGSLASLSDPASATPSFVADRAGAFILELTVTDSGGASATDAVVITTIDGTPIVSVIASDSDASEAGPNPGTFTVTRSGSQTEPLVVTFTLGGSASASDYSVASIDTVTIPAGEASAPVLVTPIPDVELEGDETLTLTLVDGAAYDLGSPMVASMTIADDPPSIVVTASVPDTAESGSAPGEFTVTRGGAITATRDVVVTFTGTATLDDDYTVTGAAIVDSGATSVTVRIPVGETAVTLTVTPIGDLTQWAAAEGPEEVVATAEGSEARVTIADEPLVILTAPDAEAAEGGGDPGTLTVTRGMDASLGFDRDTTVTFAATGAGTAILDDDFTVTGAAIVGRGSGFVTVRIPAGEEAVTLTVTPIGGLTQWAALEGPEEVVATAEGSEARVTIADEPLVVLTAPDAEAAEGGADPGTLMVTRGMNASHGFDRETTVTFASTGAGTAILDNDYTVASAAFIGSGAGYVTVRIPAGQAAVTLTVTPVGGLSQWAAAEGPEQVIATAEGGEARVTIADEPLVVVAATDPKAEEDRPNPGTFTVSRGIGANPGFDRDLSLTLSGTATPGDDYAVTGAAIVEATGDTLLLRIPTGQVSVTLTVTAPGDGVLEGPETVIATVEGSVAQVTINDIPVTLSLPDAPVVGIGASTPLLVTLGAPAPDGGVIVSLASDDNGVVVPASPGTVFVAAGETTGIVELTGVATGTTTIRSDAIGYMDGALPVTATNNIISLPASLNVPLGQATNLPVTITREGGNNGPIVVSLSSSDPSVVALGAPTLTIPAGELSANASVTGVGVGSATMTAMAPNFVGDTSALTTSANLDITVPTLSINSAFGGTITIELESPPGSPVAAPAGGVPVTISMSASGCVTVPATTTIAQGTTSISVPVSYGGSATLPCTTDITVSGPAGVDLDTVSVTVTQAPGITVSAPATVGGGLQVTGTLTLGASQHGGVMVRIESKDPSRILIAPSTTTVGQPVIEVPVANGTQTANFVVQATDWVVGSSTAADAVVEVSATGFTNGTDTVTYVQPAIGLLGLPPSLNSLDPNRAFGARVGIAVNGTVVGQARRAGGSDIEVTFTSSNPTVGELDGPGGTTQQAQQTLKIVAEASDTPSGAGGVQFDPLTAGNTTVTATSTPQFLAVGAAVTVTVIQLPGITVNAPAAVGGGLQVAGTLTLGALQHGGVTVRIESDDPRILISENATTVGRASIDVPVADGANFVSYVLQATDWVVGSSTAGAATVTVSADGFNNGTDTVNYVQPAIGILSLPSSMTMLDPNRAFGARVGIPVSGTVVGQARRAGGSDIEVTFTSSHPAVGELDGPGGTTGQAQQTLKIVAGASDTPSGAGGVQFDPLSGGSTTVTATATAQFLAVGAAVTVTVIQLPGITVNAPAAVGGGLQVAGSLTLLASQHGDVMVRIESKDPSRILIAPNATTVGQAFIDVPVANGIQFVSYVVQATDWVVGSSTSAVAVVEVTAPGFNTGTDTVNYVQPAVGILSLPPSMTVLDPNRAFGARVGIPVSGNVVAQARRAGASQLTVTFTNSAQPVAELDQSGGLNGAQMQTASIIPGSSDTPAGSVEFDPLGTGMTSVTVALAGFVAAGATVTVTVSTPGISVAAPATVGGGLQVAGSLTLLASQHGGVTVRVESKDPSRILIAPNATTVGQAFIDLPVANGSQVVSYVVQATDWVVGSSPATAVVEVTADGFNNGTDVVNYVQPAIGIHSLPLSMGALDSNRAFFARIGIPVSGTVSGQARRAGGSGVVVTFTSSNPTVGELDGPGGTSGQAEQTLTIAAGSLDTPAGAGGVQFDPLSGGSTTVTASTPGFLAAGAMVVVTVSP